MGLFTDLEMAAYLRYLPSPEPPKDYQPPTTFPCISQAKSICVDLETHDPSIAAGEGCGVRRGGYIVGVGIRTSDGLIHDYWPMRHSWGPNCDPEKVEAWLQNELSSYTGEIIGSNLLYDGDYLQSKKIKPLGRWRDIQFAEPLLDEYADSYGLDALAEKYLGVKKGTSDLVKLYGPDVMKHFREVHPGHASIYSKIDTAYPFDILEKQKIELGKQNLLELFDLECRLTPLLLYMRELGIRVDLEAAEKANQYLIGKRDIELLAMSKIAGFDVDPESGPQLAKACDSLGIAYQLTEKGNPSFQAAWIKQQKHPFFKHLAEARKYEDCRTPFVTNYILKGNINGRIHAEFNPLRRADTQGGTHGTVTGRFSSTNPNLQNIPARDKELGPMLRSLFLPDEGMEMFSADYSQMEFRLIVNAAVLLKCKGAQEALERYRKDPSTDFHNMVVELSGIERRQAKNINFAKAFCAGRFKTATMLDMIEDGQPTPEADKFIRQYDNAVPFVSEASNALMKLAERRGYIKTVLGRRCRFDLWEDKYSKPGSYKTLALPYEEAVKEWGNNIRRAGLHRALNRYTQGSNADFTKQAMVDNWEAGLFKGPLRLAITVHDELVGSREVGNIYTTGQLTHSMETCITKNVIVPVRAEIGIGNNWKEAH